MAGSVKKDGKSWYYVLEVGTINGKRKQKKKRGFATKKEAQSALIEAEHSLIKDGYKETTKLLYKDFLVEWLNNKKTVIRESTYSTYSWLINNFIIPEIGDNDITKVSPIQIQTLYSKLLNNGNLSTENISKIHSLINNSLDRAYRWGLIKKNSAELVEKPRIQKKEMKVWTIDEVKTFLEISKSSRYHIAFVLALTTGMRRGEILGLRWKDINFNSNVLSVVQTLSVDGKKILSTTKSKTSNRNITLPTETINLLRLHFALIQKEKEYAGILYNDNDLVVSTNIGTPCIPRNLNRIFYSLLGQTKLTRIRFHDLRHTHATILLHQGVHPKIVAERLGHSNIKITLDTYSHVLPSMQTEMALKLNNILFN